MAATIAYHPDAAHQLNIRELERPPVRSFDLGSESEHLHNVIRKVEYQINLRPEVSLTTDDIRRLVGPHVCRQVMRKYKPVSKYTTQDLSHIAQQYFLVVGKNDFIPYFGVEHTYPLTATGVSVEKLKEVLNDFNPLQIKALLKRMTCILAMDGSPPHGEERVLTFAVIEFGSEGDDTKAFHIDCRLEKESDDYDAREQLANLVINIHHLRDMLVEKNNEYKKDEDHRENRPVKAYCLPFGRYLVASDEEATWINLFLAYYRTKNWDLIPFDDLRDRIRCMMARELLKDGMRFPARSLSIPIGVFHNAMYYNLSADQKKEVCRLRRMPEDQQPLWIRYSDISAKDLTLVQTSSNRVKNSVPPEKRVPIPRKQQKQQLDVNESMDDDADEGDNSPLILNKKPGPKSKIVNKGQKLLEQQARPSKSPETNVPKKQSPALKRVMGPKSRTESTVEKLKNKTSPVKQSAPAANGSNSRPEVSASQIMGAVPDLHLQIVKQVIVQLEDRFQRLEKKQMELESQLNRMVPKIGRPQKRPVPQSDSRSRVGSPSVKVKRSASPNGQKDSIKKKARSSTPPLVAEASRIGARRHAAYSIPKSVKVLKQRISVLVKGSLREDLYKLGIRNFELARDDYAKRNARRGRSLTSRRFYCAMCQVEFSVAKKHVVNELYKEDHLHSPDLALLFLSPRNIVDGEHVPLNNEKKDEKFLNKLAEVVNECYHEKGFPLIKSKERGKNIPDESDNEVESDDNYVSDEDTDEQSGTHEVSDDEEEEEEDE